MSSVKRLYYIPSILCAYAVAFTMQYNLATAQTHKKKRTAKASTNNTAHNIIGRWCSEEDGKPAMTINETVIIYHFDNSTDSDLIVSYTVSKRSCDTTYMRVEGDGRAEFLATSEGLCWEILNASDKYLSLQYSDNAKRSLYIRCGNKRK